MVPCPIRPPAELGALGVGIAEVGVAGVVNMAVVNSAAVDIPGPYIPGADIARARLAVDVVAAVGVAELAVPGREVPEAGLRHHSLLLFDGSMVGYAKLSGFCKNDPKDDGLGQVKDSFGEDFFSYAEASMPAGNNIRRDMDERWRRESNGRVTVPSWVKEEA